MQNQALVQREKEVKTALVAQQKIIKSLFGDKKKSDKFLATAVKVATDYKLANCNVNSVVDACVTVAQLNLDLSPALSHAYLVPFKGNIQLIISSRGYTALLARYGWKIKSYIVNEDDFFKYEVNGFEETIKFKKNLDSEDESLKYAVALAKSPDGTLYIEIMNKSQIEKHRKVSSNQKSDNPTGVWLDWYDQMALKTVIKKLVKKLPLGEDVANALSVDDKTIEADIVEDKKEVDVNALLLAKDETVNKTTGEVTNAYKPNMSILDGVNADGTDKEEDIYNEI